MVGIEWWALALALFRPARCRARRALSPHVLVRMVNSDEEEWRAGVKASRCCLSARPS
jgi:hypothetical protein